MLEARKVQLAIAFVDRISLVLRSLRLDRDALDASDLPLNFIGLRIRIRKRNIAIHPQYLHPNEVGVLHGDLVGNPLCTLEVCDRV